MTRKDLFRRKDELLIIVGSSGSDIFEPSLVFIKIRVGKSCQLEHCCKLGVLELAVPEKDLQLEQRRHEAYLLTPPGVLLL